MNDIDKEIIEVKAQCKGNTRRIEVLENLSNVIHEQTTHIAELVGELKHTNEHIVNHEERLGKLEAEPQARSKEIFKAIITAVSSAVVGGLIGALLKAAGII